MASAKLYVSANVVDRLTRPISNGGNNENADESNMTKTFDNSDRQVMDVATFMSGGATTGVGSSSFATPGGSGGGTGPTGTTAAPLSEVEQAERKKQFEQFIFRQQQILAKKAQKRAEVYMWFQSSLVRQLII
jgi:hypothetical protein